MSLTMSPLHLLMPVFEPWVEVRAGRWVGVAVFVGIGSLAVDTAAEERVHASVFELGGQCVAYPLRDFEKLQLGVEAAFISLDAEATGTVAGFGDGTTVGAFVGYKNIARKGFTWFVQGGIARFDVEAHASDSVTGESARMRLTGVGPLLNLNLGWSF